MQDLAVLKILIIDDEPSNLKMLSKALSRKGYHTEIAENSEEGIKKIDSNDYNLILTDIKMSGVSGEQVAYHINDIKGGSIPIVGMSGTPWLFDEHNFDAVLHKPCLIKEILAVIKQLI